MAKKKVIRSTAKLATLDEFPGEEGKLRAWSGVSLRLELA